ncbi:FecCD transport family protein [Thiocapsa rosea]|uniref:FecCD transport family protein n=2 Tax=Thiocapsa rosea TaxID=69360 RepID=A0A495VCR7_9GAMM|nr:FecCD transport family protein [Thiocapsa rosea]
MRLLAGPAQDGIGTRIVWNIRLPRVAAALLAGAALGLAGTLYPGSRVLSGLAAQALTAVLGPNGVGKSTLLKLVAGILPLQSGRIRLDGADLPHLSRARRARLVAYLPQMIRPVQVSVFEAFLLGYAVMVPCGST